MKLWRLLPILLVVASSAAVGAAGDAAAQPLTRAEQSLRDAEQKRFAAMVANDLESLSRSLADELTYGHSSGLFQTKAGFLGDLETGKMRYRRMNVLEQHFRLHGSIGIVNGVLRVAVHINDADSEFSLRYTDVYLRRSGRWQLLAWQSTRLPE
jgi:hypothetical protein